MGHHLLAAAWPLLACSVAAVAHLALRTWRSVVTGGWLWDCAAVAGVIIALTLAAGTVAQAARRLVSTGQRSCLSLEETIRVLRTMW